MQQERYMRRAMELAELGRGWTKTNPVVGAVLVKEDRIIGEGYHKKFGGLHAEREGAGGLQEQGRGSGRSRSLCDIRTMLPLRENASVYTGGHRSRDQPCVCWGGRHQSACGGSRDPAVKGAGHPGDGRSFTGGM